MSNDTELKEITVWINPDFDEIQMGQIVATTTSEFDFNGVLMFLIKVLLLV